MKPITKTFKKLKEEIQDIREMVDEAKQHLNRFNNADNDEEISKALEELSKGDKDKASYIKHRWIESERRIAEARLDELFELQLQFTSIKITRIKIILDKLETRLLNDLEYHIRIEDTFCLIKKSLEEECSKLSNLVLTRNLSLDERLKLF